MTTKIKNTTAIKNAITSALEAASLNAEDLKVTKTGSVSFTISTAPTAKPETTKPETTSTPDKKSTGLDFAYGERAKLKAKYIEAYKTVDGLQRNFFGKQIVINDTPVLVIGVKDCKVLVRKENGKRSKISAKTVKTAWEAKLSADLPFDLPTETETNSKSWSFANPKVPGPKLDSDTSSELKAKFNKAEKKRNIGYKFKQAFQKGDVKAQLVGIVESGTKLRLYVPKTQKFLRVALDNVNTGAA